MTLNKNILQSAYENAMLEVDSVHNEIMATLREKVETKSPYTFTVPTTEKRRWLTNYIAEVGNAKCK